jgi:hypothetical protein
MSKNMAVIDNNGLVLNIICCDDNELENDNLVVYLENNPAYIGGDYVDGYFYAPQPFASWSRDKGSWIPPTPMPTDDKCYWDESKLTWIAIES